VSSAEKAAHTLTKLENYDLRVLRAIEIGMMQHQVVPHEKVVRYSGLNINEIDYRINNLHKYELIYREKDPYLGYLINYTGYDLLALNALVKGEVLEYLGSPIGVGKEADIYEGLTPDEERVAVKFHRLGRTSFRDTRRKREYISDRRHISWQYQSRLAAETEFRALQLTNRHGVHVPKPIRQNRHVIVMQYIDGTQLSEITSLKDPERLLKDILENVKKAYSAKIIHSDLSEYNVLVDIEDRAWIIDWPQYISTDHPNAEEILERDIGNILNYFNKKHDIKMTLSDALKYVKVKIELS